jgi:hypothetical protein
MDEIINMEDMDAVYEISDALGIDRESINVELGKEDPGAWGKGTGGMMKQEVFEITLPLTTPLEEWLPTLRKGLEELM